MVPNNRGPRRHRPKTEMKRKNPESQAYDLFLHPTDTLGLSLAILASITSIQLAG
jgi:hypothetical protein